MRRRSFFRAFAGASTAVPGAIAAKPKTPQMQVLVQQCQCGSYYIMRGRDYDGSLWTMCHNPDCSQFNIPVVPLTTVPAQLADPEMVRKYNEAERLFVISQYKRAWEKRLEQGVSGPVEPWEEGKLYSPGIIRDGKMILLYG